MLSYNDRDSGIFLKDPKTGNKVDLSDLVYTYKWPTDSNAYQSALSTGKYDALCFGIDNITSRVRNLLECHATLNF